MRPKIDPVHWFLHDKDDVRSSYHLEDVGTEFLVQGLELDWACVVWDADLRHGKTGWQHGEFVGTRWNRIHKPPRQRYLENAYRVLLTRARQGMVIVVPQGDHNDATRRPELYDPTYEFFGEAGGWCRREGGGRAFRWLRNVQFRGARESRRGRNPTAGFTPLYAADST